jgi:hypothetical protein
MFSEWEFPPLAGNLHRVKANPSISPLPCGKLVEQKELEDWYSRRGFKSVFEKSLFLRRDV